MNTSLHLILKPFIKNAVYYLGDREQFEIWPYSVGQIGLEGMKIFQYPKTVSTLH